MLDDYTSVPEGCMPPLISSAKPPFGYYGAKQRLSRRIVNSLPPHNAWVEAFCGSAAITLAKKPVPIEIINDLDGQVVNLFRQLRENPQELCRAVALTPYSREEHTAARRSTMADEPLERARLFLVSTMMTVNGAVGASSSGFSFSQSYARDGREARVTRWYNLPDRLERVVERLRCIRIENRDARELLQMFSDRPATLIYLDPPYFVKRGHKYYVDANEESFHKELLDICCRARCMVLLSGYDNDLYNKVLTPQAGWARTEMHATTRDTTGKDYERTEVLWKNAVFVKAENTGRLPLRLSAKEKAQGKLNPPRG